MVDITQKSTTLREARAQATVTVSDQKTIQAVENNAVPKGNVFEMAKAAGLLGIKKTPDLLPDCHPLPIEFAGISYQIEGLKILISVDVKTIYKTGVEVEAMHGASVVALTIYDMLKPIDKGVEISNIRLVEKKGGKTDFNDKGRFDVRTGVVVCSSLVENGSKEDKVSDLVRQKLKSCGVQMLQHTVVPDERERIAEAMDSMLKEGANMVIFCGGTGVSKGDITPDAVKPLLDREIPGIMEAARSYGQNRTPYAMLSRSLAGIKNNALVLVIPGSVKGAGETLDALLPGVLHVFKSIPQK